MSQFSIATRSENIKFFESERYDLLVIGGGITGAGVARDAAQRGLKVALVEANDFSSGTSSRSSKLVHGGIRYLENLEFKLVFEALSERQKLFKMAPHLVHPLRFMIPIYKSSQHGLNTIDLGMWLYDALSLFRTPKLHERLGYKKTLERMPNLQSLDLVGSVLYSDAYMDDDRLVFETLRSASKDGARCANYMKAVSFEDASIVQGGFCKVQCHDQVHGKKISIFAKHIVSAAGPWTDQLGNQLTTDWKKILRPTKGVHLTFEKERLNLNSAVVMGAEKRIVFGIPRHEMTIVGTTDTDFQNDPSDVSASAEDVKYLIEVTNQYFPGAKVSAKDIIASYAGVRPLVKDDSGSEGKTSREHKIFTHKSKITFVAGGKYTTYRLMAEQIVDECLKYFSKDDLSKLRKAHSTAPLNSMVSQDTWDQKDDLIRELLAQKKTDSGTIQRLVQRHGHEAIEIIRSSEGYRYWQIEALHSIKETMCLSLVDFYTRRVPMVLSLSDHGMSEFNAVAKVFKDFYHWSDEKVENERSNLEGYLNKEFAWRQKVT